MHPGPPMLWAESERKRLLTGTGVEERVEEDLKRVEEDFMAAVLPFMQCHTHTFRYSSPVKRQSQRRDAMAAVLLLALCRKALHSAAVFRQLVGLVMSYSFTDAEEEDLLQRTVMVPFVDLLNHHSQHHAELTFGQKYLCLVAVRSISKVGGWGLWQWGSG